MRLGLVRVFYALHQALFEFSTLLLKLEVKGDLSVNKAAVLRSFFGAAFMMGAVVPRQKEKSELRGESWRDFREPVVQVERGCKWLTPHEKTDLEKSARVWSGHKLLSRSPVTSCFAVVDFFF